MKKFLIKQLSYLYKQAITFRHFLYRIGFFKTVSIEGAKIICVGNIVAGGTGKTPLILKILEGLNAPKVALLSRGYKRPRFPKKGTWEEIGDEPALIQRRFPQVELYIGADRVKSARQAVADGHHIILMDDGLQHLRLKKDITIATVDGEDPYGGNEFLPYGRLRDLPEVLDGCDAIVVKGTDFERADVMFRVKCKKTVDVDQVAIFCGIAKPHQFKKSVEGLGYKVVNELFVGDHDLVNLDILEQFSAESLQKGAKVLLCTEKDVVKYPSSLKLALPLVAVHADLEVLKGEEFWNRLIKRMLE